MAKRWPGLARANAKRAYVIKLAVEGARTPSMEAPCFAHEVGGDLEWRSTREGAVRFRSAVEAAQVAEMADRLKATRAGRKITVEEV